MRVHAAGAWTIVDEPLNIVLEHLRAIRTKLGEHDTRFDQLMERMKRIELATVGLRREQASDAENVAHLVHRMDRFDSELDRIKRRLELID